MKQTILLTLILHLNYFSDAQKIGVIENSNFLSKNLKHYRAHLRTIFFKQNEDWIPFYNCNNDSTQPKTKLINFKIRNQGKPLIIKGQLIHPEKCEVFEIDKTNLKFIKIPTAISRGFENSDIKSYIVITENEEIHQTVSLKQLNLTRLEKDIIQKELILKCQSCFEMCNDSTAFISVLNAKINPVIRIFNDSTKIGTIEIPEGNICFTEPNRSYGGGQLNFLIINGNRIQFLYTNTELIDVYDFDGDGQKEALFMKSWFNNYGYILYYSNFEKHVTNEWTYH